MQKGNPFMDEDRATVATCAFFLLHLALTSTHSISGITRTKLRLVRCRNRMNMDQRDRLKDARADLNLDDVSRSPNPWEIATSEPLALHVTS